MPAEPLLVGIDVGTSAAKGAVFDLDGNVLGLAEAGYGVDRPAPGWAEQDPESWWRALRAVLRDLGEQTRLSDVIAIGICSQVNTHALVDADGLPLAPAILWQDQCCAAVAAAIDDGLSAQDRQALWGGPFTVDASFLPARAEWFRRNRPNEWKRGGWILSPKDYLNLRLTGIVATDPISPIGLVDATGNYIERVFDLVPEARSRMPPIREAAAPLGTMTSSELGLPPGVVVVVATMDAWANLYGSGVTEAGQGMEVGGTSEIVGVLSTESQPTPGVISFHPVDGLYLHAGPTQAGGEALRWFAEVLGVDIPHVLAEAASVPPGSDGLIFAPHLLGERAPLWDSDARAVFFGIGAGHSRAHLARAVLEGVAFSARHLLEAIEQAAGVHLQALNASGGGSRSDLWCQIKANVFGRDLRRLQVLHSGVLGAALLAGKGAGVFADLREAAGRATHVESTFEPGVAETALYDELYAIYRDLYPALKQSYERLNLFRAAGVPAEKGGESDRFRTDTRAAAR